MRKQLIFAILILVVSVACAVPGLNRNQPEPAGTTPVVTISSPVAGQKLEVGQTVDVLSTSVDTSGVVRTELVVDGQVVWVDANAAPQPDTPFIVAQPWTPEQTGSHVIEVRAYNLDNTAGQSNPLPVEVVTASAQVVEDESPTATPAAETPESTNTPVSPLQDAPTPESSSTPSPRPATATPTSTPTLVITLPPPTGTPTPGVFTATGLLPEGRFKEIWEELGAGQSRLGYPTGPEISDRDFARQYFEQGVMIWWDNPDEEEDYIWVIDSPAEDLKSGTTWNRYPDTWAGEDEYACDAARANAEKGPVRGFGQLWCDRPELQVRLGNPRESEAGSGGTPPYAHVQFFQGGLMFYNPLNSEVYVLYDQGDWQRFGW